MAASIWTTGTSGLWNTATNWTPGTVPNDPTAAVTIDAVPVPAGGAYIVTIGTNTTDTVASLTMNGTINLTGSNTAPYNAAELELDGTLAFGAGSLGRLNGSLQTFMHTAGGMNAEMINAGTVDAFIQVEGNLLITGTNGFYATNYVQALAGTVTVDTAAINEMTGNVLFDGIFEAKGPNSAVKLGGALQHLVVNIGTVEGPPLVPGGWTELTFNDPSAAITEWNGTAYASVETTLTDIRSGGTVDVLAARNYTAGTATAPIALTVEAGNPAAPGPGMLNLQAGTVTTAGININAGIVQGFGTIVGPVANNGTLIALGGDLNLTGALTGTGVVKFDTDVKNGGTINPVGARLDVTSVAAGETITMNGDNILVLNTPAAFAGSIAAKVGDRFVLTGITAASAVDTNGTLVVSNAAGATVATLGLSGSYANDRFDVSGSNITVAAVGSPPTPTPTPLPTPTPTPTPGAGHFTIIDTTTGAPLADTSTAYPGPVAGIQWQFITSTTDSLAITATSPNTFIHTGSGTDAINVSKVNGTNVLDGSTGSNFLVGGTGFDTFFVDDRSPAADVFSTVVGFHSGDNATIFGVTPTDFKLNTLDNQGAAGFTGLDFGFSAPGKANANLVLTGYTTADLTNGKLTTTFGTNAATASAPASTFMLIHAN